MTTLSLDVQEWRLLALDNIDRLKSAVLDFGDAPTAEQVTEISQHTARMNVLFRAWQNAAVPPKEESDWVRDGRLIATTIGASTPAPVDDIEANAIAAAYNAVLGKNANGAAPELVVSTKRKGGWPKGRKRGPSKTATRAAAQ